MGTLGDSDDGWRSVRELASELGFKGCHGEGGGSHGEGEGRVPRRRGGEGAIEKRRGRVPR